MLFILSSLNKILNEDSSGIIQIQKVRHFIMHFGEEIDSIMPIQKFLDSPGY